MAQILKLREAGSTWQRLIDVLRRDAEKAVIEDDDNRPVAVVVPIGLFQRYESERERDFAVFAEVREALRDYDPEELQARVDQAVEEVKARSRPHGATA